MTRKEQIAVKLGIMKEQHRKEMVNLEKRIASAEGEIIAQRDGEINRQTYQMNNRVQDAER